MSEPKDVYAKPDYDESRSVSYEVWFRNWIGVKQLKTLSISFQKLQVVISEPDNCKAVATLPASCIKMAIPSQNVDTQVTIMTQAVDRDAYKIWVHDGEEAKVKMIIRDINKLVELYRDVLEEQTQQAK
ncbi:Conserved_hypothetical protein [Hexamita inflata]|uniref:Uncharacterized protein n=1 Tax=Hexamita inflata TaxID=28002 RepID=A0AA86PIU2_9EUKA|nr:Conserved hypothetical protein [Hexamita inflata]CAI9953839.1 Conserved hypothetical protein [Hexamita inflata]CAI9961580.1 Conserved hypothetical protein [Hexamita inflata]CAI9965015.1 Conserved hypothetical protein [Hexamita inflata]